MNTDRSVLAFHRSQRLGIHVPVRVQHRLELLQLLCGGRPYTPMTPHDALQAPPGGHILPSLSRLTRTTQRPAFTSVCTHRYVTWMPKFIQILPWLTLIHVRDLRPARSLHHALRSAGVNHARTSFVLSARHQCGRDATFPSNSAILSISYVHSISGHRFPGSVSV